MKAATLMLALTCLALTCQAQVSGAAKPGAAPAAAVQDVVTMSTLKLGVTPDFLEKLGRVRLYELPECDRDSLLATNADREVCAWLETEGVAWPAGSSLVYLRLSGTLHVRNTPANLEKIRVALNELNVTPRQVRVDAQFVAYDPVDIARLVATGKVSVTSLTALWTGGKGELLAAPTMVTKAGQEAVVKGVTEVIYPTRFTVVPSAHAADAKAAGGGDGVVEPGGFQTREVGVIQQVVPEVSDDRHLINLTLNPAHTELPQWENFGGSYRDGSVERQLSMRQPCFYALCLSTSASVKSGQRFLLGGGMPSTDGKRTVYVFITATLVDLSGEPLKFRDE